MRGTPNDRYVEVRGIRLHYVAWPGAGPPVVLLHPNRTNARVWDFAVRASRRDQRVLALDHRGHGLSDWPERGYQLADYVADDIAFIEATSGEPVVLVGAATGGNIALLLASQRPDLVRALAVVDPGLSLDPAINQRVQRELTEGYELASRQAARAALPFSELWTDAMRDHMVRHSVRDAGNGRLTWAYKLEAATETEAALETGLWDQVVVGCPMLVVRGALSEVFDRSRMLRLADLVPGSLLVEAPRANHRVMQDNPAFLGAVLDGFLAAVLDDAPLALPAPAEG